MRLYSLDGSYIFNPFQHLTLSFIPFLLALWDTTSYLGFRFLPLAALDFYTTFETLKNWPSKQKCGGKCKQTALLRGILVIHRLFKPQREWDGTKKEIFVLLTPMVTCYHFTHHCVRQGRCFPRDLQDKCGYSKQANTHLQIIFMILLLFLHFPHHVPYLV